jgi:hypothetical protein
MLAPFMEKYLVTCLVINNRFFKNEQVLGFLNTNLPATLCVRQVFLF